MANTKSKRRNLQRFRKLYPYIRRSPRFTQIFDKATTIEAGSIAFSNESSKSYTFSSTFGSAPTITAISVSNANVPGSANVNVFVSAISLTTVTFNTSQNFTGNVDFHAILIS